MLTIGHRGAKGLASENTLASLEAGLAARADMLEIDVRVSSDGTAVLCHDPYLLDANKKKYPIAKTTFADLQVAKMDMLTLEAALQFVDRRADMIIEIKPGVDIGPIAACIEPRITKSWIESDLILTSFDVKVLQKLHEQFPTLPIAILEKWSGVRARYRARKLGTKRIIMNKKWLWSGFIRAVSKRDYKLYAYTINNPAKAQKWAKHGLYGAITDYPDRFKSSL